MKDISSVGLRAAARAHWRLFLVVITTALTLTGSAVLGAVPALAAGAGRLGSGQRMVAGQSLTSPNGRFRLVMQGDGNLVEYVCSRALWQTHTGGNPGAFVVMQTAGNLVVYSAGGAALWWSDLGTSPGATLRVQDPGNLVIYSTAGAPVWWSTTVAVTYTPVCAGATIPAGVTVPSANTASYLEMRIDGDLVVGTSGTGAIRWESHTSGTGAWAVMQGDGNLVVYSAGGTPLWNSRTNVAGSFLAVNDAGSISVVTPNGNTTFLTGLKKVPVPSWWKGVKCSYLGAGGVPVQNGGVLATWAETGLISCGPGSTGHYTQFSSTPVQVEEWQCVELSDRWLFQEFGLPERVADGHGVAPVYWNYIKAHPELKVPLTYATPSTPGIGIGPGDVISYADGGAGHVAVVTNVTATTYRILSENWNYGTGTQYKDLPLVNGMPRGWTGYSVVGWLHFTN